MGKGMGKRKRVPSRSWLFSLSSAKRHRSSRHPPFPNLPSCSFKEDIWYRSSSAVGKEATAISFANLTDALKTVDIFDQVNDRNVPTVIAVKEGSTATEVVIPRLPKIPIMQWVESAQDDGMWTLNQDQTQYLQMKPFFQKVFKSIVEALSSLHQANKFHGNLMGGVWISDHTDDNFDLKVANFNVKMDFQTGFLKDLEDLRTLLEIAVSKHSKNIVGNDHCPKQPPCLESFYSVHNQCMSLVHDFKKMREFVSFVYWAPVFWNWMDVYKFICKLDNFSKSDVNHFKKIMLRDVMADEEEDSQAMAGMNKKQRKRMKWKEKLKRKKRKELPRVLQYAMPKTKNWDMLVTSLPEKHPLLKLYEADKGYGSMYDNSGGIYWFYKNVIHHYACPGGAVASENIRAGLDDLLNHFPEAIPAIFERMINILHDNPENENKFRTKLIPFMKTKPHRFK